MIHLPFQAVNHSSTSHRSPESKFQSDAVENGSPIPELIQDNQAFEGMSHGGRL
jgi:hypothetical protein